MSHEITYVFVSLSLRTDLKSESHIPSNNWIKVECQFSECQDMLRHSYCRDNCTCYSYGIHVLSNNFEKRTSKNQTLFQPFRGRLSVYRYFSGLQSLTWNISPTISTFVRTVVFHIKRRFSRILPVALHVCTGWKEKFARGYHRWILHLRFDGNTCKNLAAELILTLHFKVKKFLFLALYSTHHEGKTFPRNLIVFLKNGRNVSYSFNIADACAF